MITRMKAKDISVGDIYYVQSKYDCKSCYKVQVTEIINDKYVMVKGMTKSKKEKKKQSLLDLPYRHYIGHLIKRLADISSITNHISGGWISHLPLLTDWRNELLRTKIKLL